MSFGRWEGFIQGSPFVRSEVIHHDSEPGSLGIKLIHQPFHSLRKIDLGVLFSDAHITFSGQGFIKHVQIPNAIAFILIIVACLLSGSAGVAFACFLNQLFQTFIKTNQEVLGIIGAFVLIQDFFHAGYIFRAGLWNAPHFFLPWLYRVFLSVRRMVTYEIESTTSSSTIFPASKRRVQCSCLQVPGCKPLQSRWLRHDHPDFVSVPVTDLRSRLSPCLLVQTAYESVLHMVGLRSVPP